MKAIYYTKLVNSEILPLLLLLPLLNENNEVGAYAILIYDYCMSSVNSNDSSNTNGRPHFWGGERSSMGQFISS